MPTVPISIVDQGWLLELASREFVQPAFIPSVFPLSPFFHLTPEKECFLLLWMKRGHILNLISSGEAGLVELQTQRPKITTWDGFKLKLFT